MLFSKREKKNPRTEKGKPVPGAVVHSVRLVCWLGRRRGTLRRRRLLTKRLSDPGRKPPTSQGEEWFGVQWLLTERNGTRQRNSPLGIRRVKERMQRLAFRAIWDPWFCSGVSSSRCVCWCVCSPFCRSVSSVHSLGSTVMTVAKAAVPAATSRFYS